MKKGYCEKCDKLVPYKIKEEKSCFNVKGKTYEYLELVPYCEVCGEIVGTEDVVDENFKRKNDVFRKSEGIITQEEIEEILQKYKIGKKPLSKLLGWGEVTLTRYINGDVPTKPYSEELYKILNDTSYMEELLEKNKDRITAVAYKNVKNVIKNYNDGKSYKAKNTDIELIAEYIIFKCQEITPLALQKLLYYAQGFYYAFFRDFLYKENCEAWVHGPVYTGIYNKYKNFTFSNIEQYLDYDISEVLDEDKKALLDIIINSFGYYNGKALEKMTHYENPWIEARKGVPADKKSNNIIQKEDIGEYFLKIKEKYEMINLLEIKKYSRQQFDTVINL